MNKQRFDLGEDDVLTHEDIGQPIYVDHFAQMPNSAELMRDAGLGRWMTAPAGGRGPRSWALRSYVGVLAGFTENRGMTETDTGEKAKEDLDIASFPDYSVNILLVDGREIRVREVDRAQVTLPNRPTPKDAE